MKKLLLLILTGVIPASAMSQAGFLDYSFNGTGIITHDVGSMGSWINSLAQQPDGRIIAAGVAGNATMDRVLVRYELNGLPDTSFGVDGIVTTDVNSYNDNAYAVALQADGKIIVAGSALEANVFPNNLTMIRYHIDGYIDSAFGINGMVITAVGDTNSSARAILIEADDKIVVSGQGLLNDIFHMVVARYLKDGTPDSTFDSDGVAILNLGSNVLGRSICRQPDGKYVITGNRTDGNDHWLIVLRLNEDGSADSTFDGDGIFQIEDFYGSSVIVQSDDKIVVAGETNDDNNFPDIAMLRFLPDGTPDSSFEGDGFVFTPIGNEDETAFSCLLQPDGKLIAVGYTSEYNIWTDEYDYKFAVVRYNTDGHLDGSFGFGGIATTSVGEFELVRTGLLQSDGKIVAGGLGTPDGSSSGEFALVRYLNDLALGYTPAYQGEFKFEVYPNPFSSSAIVSFSLEENSTVTIKFFDVAGREIKMLFSENLQSGNHHVPLNLEEISAGIYFLELEKNEGSAVMKVIIE